MNRCERTSVFSLMGGELTPGVYRLATETEKLRRPSIGSQSNRRTSVSTELDNVPRSLDNVREGVAMLGRKSLAALGLQSVLQPKPEVSPCIIYWINTLRYSRIPACRSRKGGYRVLGCTIARMPAPGRNRLSHRIANPPSSVRPRLGGWHDFPGGRRRRFAHVFLRA